MLYRELNVLMCETLVGSLSSVFKYPLACSLSLMFAFCKGEVPTLNGWMKAVQALVIEMEHILSCLPCSWDPATVSYSTLYGHLLLKMIYCLFFFLILEGYLHQNNPNLRIWGWEGGEFHSIFSSNTLHGIFSFPSFPNCYLPLVYYKQHSSR